MKPRWGAFSADMMWMKPTMGIAGLLRARRKRPRCRCTAEQRDELATPHYSMTSSARASSDGGMKLAIAVKRHGD
jgi:hypothetical protein